ncbi:MAG: hypothetical protein JWM87_2746 [Candidatus Eremiobacteraeota bacterium]|nr:hypothetical protein [Candidatus Eremiobacteraeota bacterium]
MEPSGRAILFGIPLENDVAFYHAVLAVAALGVQRQSAHDVDPRRIGTFFALCVLLFRRGIVGELLALRSKKNESG